MYTVMMYLAIRNGERCTGIGFGVDGKLQATRYFADGNWDTVTRDHELPADLYNGEVQ